MTTTMIYVTLGIAIVAEVIATTALARSESFTRLGPSVITVLGYAIAFYFLSFALRAMPTGLVYAVWSGLGIVFIAAIGWIWFGERLDTPALTGLGLIITGVVIVNVFSDTMPH
jgi:small multidrug resistance pump